MLEKIKEILSDYIETPMEQITEATDLRNDLDLSSFDFMNIIVAFEDEFNIEVPDRKLVEIITVGDVMKFLENEYRMNKN